ncbi:MAG: hypothetical protein F6K24_05110 [Okeania sp. SIO2D1]|nr:hypothetical protein [Okeania sp. SIO2D1]
MEAYLDGYKIPGTFRELIYRDFQEFPPRQNYWYVEMWFDFEVITTPQPITPEEDPLIQTIISNLDVEKV